MEKEQEAYKIIRAYAVCESGASCDLCPLYAEEKKRTKRGQCTNEITKEKLEKALQLVAMIES